MVLNKLLFLKKETTSMPDEILKCNTKAADKSDHFCIVECSLIVGLFLKKDSNVHDL